MLLESKNMYSTPAIEMFSISSESLCELSNGVTVNDFPGLGDEQEF